MIAITCNSCQKRLSVKPDLAGKKVKCPGCGAVVTVPAGVVTPSRTQAAGSLAEEPTVPPMSQPAPRDRTEQPTQPPAGQSDATQTPDPQDDHDSSLTDFLAPPQADDELGRLGKFRILKILGHGGMGVVFLGEDPKLSRKVAIKAMLPHLAQSRTSHQRFLREAKTAAALEHDHIVPILHVDEDRGAPYIVMPFLQGEPLDKRLRDGKPMPIGDILRIGIETAEGLSAAHERGLVHRDIKPANIWLEGKKGRVKILDFGLARATADSGLTQQGAIIGTPAYMAPEQGRGDEVDGRCDLWSLGVVLYRLCTGLPPFVGKDTVATLMAVAMHEPKSPHELNVEIPAELSSLVMHLLEKDPEKRIGKAEEVVAHLRKMENDWTRAHDEDSRIRLATVAPNAMQTAIVTSPPTQRPAESATVVPPPRRPYRALVGLACGLFALVAGALYLQTPHGTLHVEVNDPKIKVADSGAAIDSGWALEFVKKGDFVELSPSLSATSALPVTLEAHVTPRTTEYGDVLSTVPTLFNLGLNKGGEQWSANCVTDSKEGRIQGAVKAIPGKKYHVAVVIADAKVVLFVDGKLIKSATLQGNASKAMGRFVVGHVQHPMIGSVHEVRISKGARYDKDFTPQHRFASDSDTLALYHCDEGQGDVLKDSSGNGHHGKIVGAKWVNLQPMPAAANFELDLSPGDMAATAHVVLPERSEASATTIEMFIRPRTTEGGPHAILLWNKLQLRLDGRTLIWRANANNTANDFDDVSMAPVMAGRRYHVAAIAVDKTLKLYVDGKLIGTKPITSPIGDIDRGMVLGRKVPVANWASFGGSIDELRISDGVRYERDFTPAERQTADPQTWALYHCDEGGGEVLKDSSGNNRHGKIVGAKWVKAGTPATPPVIVAGSALEFNGKEYVVAPVTAAMEGNLATLEAWVKPKANNLALILRLSQPVNHRLALVSGGYSGAEENTIGKITKVQPDRPAALDEWVHVAYVASDKELRLYVEGKRVAAVPRPALEAAATPLKRILLGGDLHYITGQATNFFRGQLREIRICNSVRYTEDFTPTNRFEPDKSTFVLYHCDEGQGEVLNDSSGNGHHGEIVGAKWVKTNTEQVRPASQASALKFDGNSSITMLSVSMPETGRLTLEGFFTLESDLARDGTILMSEEGKLHLVLKSNTSLRLFYGWAPNYLLGPILKKGKRTHIAAVRTEKEVQLYVDGLLAAKSDLKESNPGKAKAPGLVLGRWFEGTMSAIRISTTTRYDKTFTPPARLAPDANTLALYQIDEGEGDVLKDTSGNGLHGKIIGAKWVKTGVMPQRNP